MVTGEQGIPVVMDLHNSSARRFSSVAMRGAPIKIILKALMYFCTSEKQTNACASRWDQRLGSNLAGVTIVSRCFHWDVRSGVGVAQARRNRLRKVSKRKNSSIGPSTAWAIPSGARMA